MTKKRIQVYLTNLGVVVESETMTESENNVLTFHNGEEVVARFTKYDGWTTV